MTAEKPADDPTTTITDPPLSDGKSDSEWVEMLKTAFWAVAVALLIRTVFFEPFNIPSGSMKPNLLVGDYLFVSKYSYGYSRYSIPLGLPLFEGRVNAHEPQRGDVAVFKLPTDTSTDYIKRVIGLPGDRVQVRHGRLYINGDLVPRDPAGIEMDAGPDGGETRMQMYRETLPGGVTHVIYEESDDGPLDNTAEYTVPKGHYFMMGDNRDNSQDSRVMDHVGFVPLDNFVGPARWIFFSANGKYPLIEFWRWPQTIRFGRLLKAIR